MKAFAIALLRTLIFPREDRNIDTRLGYTIRALAKGMDVGRATFVPMIVAEIMRVIGQKKGSPIEDS